MYFLIIEGFLLRWFLKGIWLEGGGYIYGFILEEIIIDSNYMGMYNYNVLCSLLFFILYYGFRLNFCWKSCKVILNLIFFCNRGYIYL